MKVSQRKVNEWYARSHGYFWLPCPLCGEPFGGHEWGDGPNGESSTIYRDDDPRIGTGICPTCTAAGKGDEPTLWPDAYHGGPNE